MKMKIQPSISSKLRSALENCMMDNRRIYDYVKAGDIQQVKVLLLEQHELIRKTLKLSRVI